MCDGAPGWQESDLQTAAIQNTRQAPTRMRKQNAALLRWARQRNDPCRGPASGRSAPLIEGLLPIAGQQAGRSVERQPAPAAVRRALADYAARIDRVRFDVRRQGLEKRRPRGDQSKLPGALSYLFGPCSSHSHGVRDCILAITCAMLRVHGFGRWRSLSW